MSIRDSIIEKLAPHRETAAPNMYAECAVKNNKEIHRWIKTFCSVPIPVDELHCTVMYSRGNVDLGQVKAGRAFTLPANRNRKLVRLGEATALLLDDKESVYLKQMWQMFRDAGATWDFPTFVPHISISYKWEVAQHDLDKMNAWEGKIEFGPYITKPLED